jgi:hypothetical protein
MHMSRVFCAALIAAIVIFCLLMLAADQSVAQEIGKPQKVNSLAASCTSPKIVTAGTAVYVVWQGMYQGQSRVFFRERRDGVWQNEMLLDSSPDEENFDPTITTDVKGNPHIVWVSRTPRKEDAVIGTSKIHYAYRLRTEWLFPEPISVVTGQNSELPAIAVEEKGRVFIAWQEGKGTSYDIYCATQDKSGMFRKTLVSELSNKRYNLYPQVFLAPKPFIVWYEADRDSFALRGATFYEPAINWEEFPLPNLNQLPCSRLPVLVQDKLGVLLATWYDSWDSNDRILLGIQEAATRGKGSIIDDQPQRQNAFPAACVGPDNMIYVTWSGEGKDASQIFLTRGDGIGFSPSILCSDGEKGFYSSAQVAVDTTTTAHVVWYSDTLNGGNGGIYLSSVSFQ